LRWKLIAITRDNEETAIPERRDSEDARTIISDLPIRLLLSKARLLRPTYEAETDHTHLLPHSDFGCKSRVSTFRNSG
jgi:hypothetical protein